MARQLKAGGSSNGKRMPLDGQGDIVRYIKCYTQ
jgi:hypothetical protein